MQLKGLSQAISFRLFASFRYFCLFGFAFSGSFANADTLDQLSEAHQAAVARICLPLQYQEGAGAYRECVLAEVKARDSQGISAASALSFDEQYAVQQICKPVAGPTDATYQQCVNQQLDGLGQIPLTQLYSFDSDDVYALQQNCFNAQSTEGVKAYRQCINTAAAGLQALPRPDLSELTLLERNALQLRCSAQHTVAADYRQCLLEATAVTAPTETIVATQLSQIESEDGFVEPVTSLENTQTTAPELLDNSSNLEATAVEPAVEPAAGQAQLTTIPAPVATIAEELNDATPVITQSANEALPAIESDEVLTSLSVVDQSTDAIPETEPTKQKTLTESATSIAKQLWGYVQSRVSSLSNMNRMIVAAAMALPILLLGFWFLMRGREQESEIEYFAPGERNPLIDRIGPSQQRRSQQEGTRLETMQRDDNLDTPMDQTDRLNLSQQADDILSEIPDYQAQTANLDDVDTPNLGESNRPDPKQGAVDTSQRTENTDAAGAGINTRRLSEAQDPSAKEQLGSTERAGLLAWLNHRPADVRQTLAIEFLIYWLAYADDRYEPAMKETIFQIRDPDEHERIKRWVLMQDVYAFSDVVYWLQHTSTIAQREQILDLLMTLLINENALTPVQNTALRFLGDAFGLGHDQLDERFKQAYGHSMPPLPRVDKLRWWDQQPVEQQSRWDARTVSLQSRDIQYRVKLGLPLSGEVHEEDVTASFKRAAARCSPHRFNLLGPREQSLAEGQFTKFEFAKDSLLEVSV